MNKIQFLFFICTLYTSFVGAQVRDFTFVEELMHNKKYALAQSYLRSVDQESLFDYEIDRNQYYIAVCAVELFNEDANFCMDMVNYRFSINRSYASISRCCNNAVNRSVL